MGSWVSKVTARANLIYEWHCPFPDGRTGYYFIQVFPHKEMPFIRLCESGEPFDLSQYGIILAKGWGAPTPTTMRMLKEKYGVES
ncbi:hypothetical protein GC177_10360 [bacterium]|nr:hypothetical protein [bacterium]